MIYRRRGGNDLIQDHGKWRKTIKSNPDVLSMSFVSITSLLERGPAQENLDCAIEAYLTCKSIFKIMPTHVTRRNGSHIDTLNNSSFVLSVDEGKNIPLNLA